MTKRMCLSINEQAAQKLRNLQAQVERRIGFEPSLAQLVEYLVNEYFESNKDKVTGGHSVEAK